MTVICCKVTPAHPLVACRASITVLPVIVALGPLTLEPHGAMTHPGLDVSPCDQLGAAFAVATSFIQAVQVLMVDPFQSAVL